MAKNQDLGFAPNYMSALEIDLSLWQECTEDATFIVPADARPGDRFVLTLTVQTRAECSCTRYTQVAVTVA